MDYSPFNLVVWGLFLGFAALTWGVVHLFHKKFPDYPGRVDAAGIKKTL